MPPRFLLTFTRICNRSHTELIRSSETILKQRCNIGCISVQIAIEANFVSSIAHPQFTSLGIFECMYVCTRYSGSRYVSSRARDEQSATFAPFLSTTARLVAFMRDATSDESRDSALADSLSLAVYKCIAANISQWRLYTRSRYRE